MARTFTATSTDYKEIVLDDQLLVHWVSEFNWMNWVSVSFSFHSCVPLSRINSESGLFRFSNSVCWSM